MAINLLDVLRDDSALKRGENFTGAIFLTYSLNLNFFEQIIIPALEESGCSNILILVDPDGYEQAMEIGANSISEVGRSYVCTPLPRIGKGIQHAKVLFMVGPSRGKILVGSGNLTYAGYSQNLELYSHFEYDNEDRSSSIFPFVQIWNLIQKIVQEGDLTSVAEQQIAVIKEKVLWLKAEATDSDVVILHNYEKPILDQLLAWRKQHGFVTPSHKVKAISPYYDQGFSAVKQFSNKLQPEQLQLYLDPNLTNLEGKKAKQQWRGTPAKLSTFAIGPGEEEAAHRHVHAKAIVGIEENGSWCMSGSANFSYPALLSDWSSGGNLEVVTLFRSKEKKEFDYLFKDETIQSWPIDLVSISATETGPSERETTQEHNNVIIKELIFRSGRIHGVLSHPISEDLSNTVLYFRRRNQSFPVQFENNSKFTAHLDFSLDETESARLETPDFHTPYRWIDQIEVLDRNSARTYQARVKGKIETILGAEKLFEELMNFLWERVESHPESEEDDPHKMRRRTGKSHKLASAGNDPTPPAAEEFLTEERLVQDVHSGMSYHQPYDRSLYSLQDLLSLVLLRLTTETQTSTSEKNQKSDDDGENQSEFADLQEQRNEGLGRLKNYIIRYCRRYSDRLTDVAFLKKVPLKVLFQNHYTLGRVLLEIHDKSKKSDFLTEAESLECYWRLWSPLVLPEIISNNDRSAFQSLIEKVNYKKDEIRENWLATRIPYLFIVMTAEFLGKPPSWRVGLREDEKVQIFIAARRWLNKIKSELGVDLFTTNSISPPYVFGIRTLEDIFGNSETSEEVSEWHINIFNLIENYRLPSEEKFSLLHELERLTQTNFGNEETKQNLIESIKSQGLEQECTNFLANPKPLFAVLEDEDGGFYCPKCGAEIIEKISNEIRHGGLDLCHNCKNVWVYMKLDTSKSLFV